MEVRVVKFEKRRSCFPVTELWTEPCTGAFGHCYRDNTTLGNDQTLAWGSDWTRLGHCSGVRSSLMWHTGDDQRGLDAERVRSPMTGLHISGASGQPLARQVICLVARERARADAAQARSVMQRRVRSSLNARVQENLTIEITRPRLSVGGTWPPSSDRMLGVMRPFIPTEVRSPRFQHSGGANSSFLVGPL